MCEYLFPKRIHYNNYRTSSYYGLSRKKLCTNIKIARIQDVLNPYFYLFLS